MDETGRDSGTPEEAVDNSTARDHGGRFGRTVRRYLLTGLVVLLPVVVTVFVLVRMFFALDDILGRFVETYLGRAIPGVGLVALVAIILGIGAIASNIMGKRMIRAWEGIISRIPVMRWIYRTTKQLFSSLLEERSGSFRKVVLVPYPHRGSYSIAFLTSEWPTSVLTALGPGFVTVFLPTTPNPTSGLLLVVPVDDVVPLDITVEEGLRLVISAGALDNGQGDGTSRDSEYPGAGMAPGAE
ncbi:MAG: DUF502 domain-containing protein [Candidatus Eisenbacteria bacterium]|nr:DUF502 domain-containing protein [Candidatus Eisenbacteria bacterium]